MRFTEIAKYITGAEIITPSDAQITGIAYDSRKVKPGYIFVATEGGSFDGHSYIQTAIASGAVAIVAQRMIEHGDVGYCLAPSGRVAMGEIAAAFHDFPSRKIKLIGVTGTSGKTTVTHLIKSIFDAQGQKAGVIGTIGAKIGTDIIPTEHTTPESVDIQAILAQMVEKGAKVVAMEVSSHGLYQGRSEGCEFDCAVFANIARDHLDFHKTLEAYLDAKLILFRDHPAKSSKDFTAIINADDAAAAKVIEATNGKTLTFAVIAKADVTASNIEVTEKRVAFMLNTPEGSIPVELAIGGYFNVYNALSAAAAALALGLDLPSIANGLAQARAVAGRFESVECGQDFGVIVDYAHTPDELENVLSTARKITCGRLITVFGCGGDRDKGKRPLMGGIAADIADVAVVTSDNPRTEDPNAIISEVLAGIDKRNMASVIVEPDRRAAIETAISLAHPMDVVIIAGKGHEDYQIFADRTIHFDDREVAREILNATDKS